MSKLNTPLATEGKFVTDASGNVIAISATYAQDIVRCVNSHDALVDAVIQLLGCMHVAGWGEDHAAINARAVLAAAGATQ